MAGGVDGSGAGGDGAGPAPLARLVDGHDGGAGLDGGQSGGGAGAAHTYHSHIHGVGLLRGGGRDGCIESGVDGSGLLAAVQNGHLYRVGSGGGAGDGVHSKTLMLKNAGDQQLLDTGGHAHGLLIFAHFNGGKLAAGHCHGDGDLRQQVKATGGSGVGTIPQGKRDGTAASGLSQSVGYGGFGAVGGHGGAGHAVNGGAARGLHLGLQRLQSGSANGGSLLVAHQGAGGNFAAHHSDGGHDLTAKAGGLTGVSAVAAGGGEVGHVDQLGGVGGILVPLHLDAQQLAEVAQGHIGSAVVGKYLGSGAVRFSGGDLLAVDAQGHGGDGDVLLRPGCQGNRSQDHENGQRKGCDPFFHRASLLIHKTF